MTLRSALSALTAAVAIICTTLLLCKKTEPNAGEISLGEWVAVMGEPREFNEGIVPYAISANERYPKSLRLDRTNARWPFGEQAGIMPDDMPAVQITPREAAEFFRRTGLKWPSFEEIEAKYKDENVSGANLGTAFLQPCQQNKHAHGNAWKITSTCVFDSTFKQNKYRLWGGSCFCTAATCAGFKNITPEWILESESAAHCGLWAF